ncbi:MAG: hypothetical protein ACTSP3_13845 [Candidatus Heimdallarchaeaceae archaeon]
MTKLTNENILDPLPIVRTLLLFLLKRNPNSSGYQLINLVKEFTAEEGILVQKEQVTGKRIAHLYSLTNQGEQELHRLITAIKRKKEVLLEPLIKEYFKTSI